MRKELDLERANRVVTESQMDQLRTERDDLRRQLGQSLVAVQEAKAETQAVAQAGAVPPRAVGNPLRL